MSTTATPVDIFWAGINRNGKPLQFGVVTVTGIGGTGNYLYTTEDVAGANTGATFTLDADGKAEVWGHGEYQFDIVDKYGYPIAQSPFTHQTYRYLPATGAGIDATTLQGLAPRTNVVGSPTGVIPVGDDVRNPKLVADFISTIPSTHPADTLAASQLARMDIGNTLNGNQAIVAGETTLDNNKYYKGKSTGGSGLPLIGVNGSNVITVGDGGSGHVLNLTGTDVKVNNVSIPMGSLTDINSKLVIEEAFALADYEEYTITTGFIPVWAEFHTTLYPTSGPGTVHCHGFAISASTGSNGQYRVDNTTGEVTANEIGVRTSDHLWVSQFNSTAIKIKAHSAISGKVSMTAIGY